LPADRGRRSPGPAYRIGLGRYSGRSPWERHLNGDELLYVLDGEVEITLLSDSLEAEQETLRA
jgi:ethanolamine utilization protein EutQ (cupin superfamily)